MWDATCNMLHPCKALCMHYRPCLGCNGKNGCGPCLGCFGTRFGTPTGCNTTDALIFCKTTGQMHPTGRCRSVRLACLVVFGCFGFVAKGGIVELSRAHCIPNWPCLGCDGWINGCGPCLGCFRVFGSIFMCCGDWHMLGFSDGQMSIGCAGLACLGMWLMDRCWFFMHGHGMVQPRLGCSLLDSWTTLRCCMACLHTAGVCSHVCCALWHLGWQSWRLTPHVDCLGKNFIWGSHFGIPKQFVTGPQKLLCHWLEYIHWLTVFFQGECMLVDVFENIGKNPGSLKRRCHLAYPCNLQSTFPFGLAHVCWVESIGKGYFASMQMATLLVWLTSMHDLSTCQYQLSIQTLLFQPIVAESHASTAAAACFTCDPHEWVAVGSVLYVSTRCFSRKGYPWKWRSSYKSSAISSRSLVGMSIILENRCKKVGLKGIFDTWNGLEVQGRMRNRTPPSCSFGNPKGMQIQQLLLYLETSLVGEGLQNPLDPFGCHDGWRAFKYVHLSLQKVSCCHGSSEWTGSFIMLVAFVTKFAKRLTGDPCWQEHSRWLCHLFDNPNFIDIPLDNLFPILFQPLAKGHIDIIVHWCFDSTFGIPGGYSTNAGTWLSHVLKITISDGRVAEQHCRGSFANPPAISPRLNLSIKNGHFGHVGQDKVSKDAIPMDVATGKTRFVSNPHWSNNDVDSFTMNQWSKRCFQLKIHGTQMNVLSHPWGQVNLLVGTEPRLPTNHHRLSAKVQWKNKSLHLWLTGLAYLDRAWVRIFPWNALGIWGISWVKWREWSCRRAGWLIWPGHLQPRWTEPDGDIASPKKWQ